MEELNSGQPKTNPSSGREEDVNPAPPNYKSSALTTRARCLLFFDMQIMVKNRSTNVKKTELKINPGKTVVMKWNGNSRTKIQLEGRDIEEGKKFVHLGATVTTTGVAKDIQAKVGKAQADVFYNLKSISRGSQLSINTKLRIFKSSVLAVLL